MRERKAYWIGGTLTALLGVAVIRLLSPDLAGVSRSIVLVAGYALVAVGLAIIAAATRRKASEAFITINKETQD
jgi:sulfite exporter TauE/SafE